MSKDIILVATHKPDKVYEDEVYKPIHVGRTISKYKEEMNGMLGDDTGDNISEKNPMYCELTAQYWAWKNLKCDNIGLCHYRRYFSKLYTHDTINKSLSNYDIILPTPIYHHVFNDMIINKLNTILTLEDIYIFLKVLKKLYPEYEESVVKYLCGNVDIAYNMFICRKKIFDSFCEWQFSILFECEKYIKLSQYSRLRRIYGYLGEVLLPIYCYHNKLKIKYEPLVSFVSTGEINYLNPISIKSKSYKYLFKLIVKTRKIIYNRQDYYTIDRITNNTAVKVGLYNDGIEL